ncbi:MAG TPA: copper chaperone PCu(A)C [Streptosporangiaceae bacterium]|nr:copper chaperone PCu(A)C [Streptosporangiaceae bacterium]
MIDQTAPARPVTRAVRPAEGSPGWLVRAALAPVICSVLLLGLLSAWVVTGGDGTISRVRIEVTEATLAEPTQPGGPAAMYLTMVNFSGADRLVSVTTSAAQRVEFVRRQGTAQGPGQQLTSISIPARATVNLNPFTTDVVLVDPVPMTAGGTVRITLRFAGAGRVTVAAAVTPPGTP